MKDSKIIGIILLIAGAVELIILSLFTYLLVLPIIKLQTTLNMPDPVSVYVPFAIVLGIILFQIGFGIFALTHPKFHHERLTILVLISGIMSFIIAFILMYTFAISHVDNILNTIK